MTVELTAPDRKQAVTGRVRYVERDGVKLHYEIYGSGERTVFLADVVDRPLASLEDADSSRGTAASSPSTGRGKRPLGSLGEWLPRARIAADDATGTESATYRRTLTRRATSRCAAAEQPGTGRGAVFICPSVPFGEPVAQRQLYPWNEELDTDEGWAKYNR